MAKHRSEEAFNARLRQLADIKGTSSLNESRNLGELIDYKRTADGVAYGIVKENHQYYIKKGGLKENPSVADFAYIGGLSNITEHQYPSLSTADKNRNFLLTTINEGLSNKISKTGSKKEILNEDSAEKEIDAAAEKVDDLEAATDAAAVADIPEPEVSDDGGEKEMAAGIEDMPADDVAPEGGDEPEPEGELDVAPEGGEEPAPEGGEEPAPEDGEESPEGELDVDVAPEGGEEEESTGMGNVSDSLADKVGAAADDIRKEDIDAKGTAWLLGTFLSAFKPSKDEDVSKDKFRELSEKEREEYADMITNVTSAEEKDSVADTVPQDGEEMEEAEECSECGTFKEYAESRGYTVESLMECGDEEMANLVSGYANANGEGENDGDHKVIALFVTPEIIEKLKSEYGHEDFANQLEPVEMDDEEKEMEINELFGGLGALGKAAGQGIKKGAQQVGQAVSDKAQQVGQGVQQAATNIKQTYHAGELGKEVKNLEKKAADLGTQVDSLNKRMEKAGGQPLNVGSILTTIKNQIAGAKGLDLSKYGSVQEEGPEVPTDSLEVQPMMEEDGVDENVDIKVKEEKGKKLSPDNTPEVEMKEGENKMGAGFEPMGGAVVKPDSAETKIEEVQPVTEAEIKLRKYIRNRLEEKAGTRKATLNEDKKSATLQKLDKVIDKQLALFENETMNEIMGFSMKEKIAKINPNDPGQVENLFNKVFKNILTNPHMGAAIARAAKTTPPETKYEILKQYADNNGGTLRLADRDTLKYGTQQEKDAATHSMFSQGGTQGRTRYGGTAG